MRVADFSFQLPKKLIAKRPLSPRDASRLLDLSGESFVDRRMLDFPNMLCKGDVLVFNNTKVIPARLFGMRGDAKVEVTLHKKEALDCWKAFAKPARKLSVGNRFTIADDFYAEVEKKNGGEVHLRFNCSGDQLFAKLEQYGEPPIPPYMARKADADDVCQYQTIYAKEKGAVAAPTAGLHFTKTLMDAISEKGVKVVFVTLHVGAGTFLPVKAEHVKDHVMHAEYGVVSQKTAGDINTAKVEGSRIICVGTTSLRLLESAADDVGELHAFSGETDIFITPGYDFKCVDGLLTNFHLPESTLFMLVSAFCGLDKMQAAYKHAIEQQYRFYSYGDACFLLHEN